MKRMVSLFVACALSVVTPLFAEQTKNLNQVTGSLTVLVSGLKNSKGEVRIALSDSKRNYETKGDEPFRRIVRAITNLPADRILRPLLPASRSKRESDGEDQASDR